MSKIPYITSAILIVLAALFAILNKFWTGFVYFVFSSLLVLSLFWFVWLIFQYFTTFKHELEHEFQLFKANKVNRESVSAEDFDANIAEYRKMFNKKMIKTKLLKVFAILFCFAVATTFLIAMIIK